MTQDEIRKLLGGYATNALTADERRILFEAALEDQQLFNALQNEDALRELLDDPVLRDQVRRALGTPAKPSRRARFSWRQWAFGVAMPAAVAVIVIVVMNRANAPRLISMSQPAPAARPSVAAPAIVAPPASPKPAPNEVARKLPAAAPAAKKQSASLRVPQAQAIPGPVQLESARTANAPVAASFRDIAPPFIPDAVRQQFSAGFAATTPLYQGPLVQYSVARGRQDGNAVRINVSTAIPGYLALYHVDAAGNVKRVYPTTDVAMRALPNIAMQIPINPVKVDVGERLRLVLVPAAPPAVMGALGGAVNRTVLGTGAAPLAAPSPTPLIVDIPLAAN